MQNKENNNYNTPIVVEDSMGACLSSPSAVAATIPPPPSSSSTSAAAAEQKKNGLGTKKSSSPPPNSNTKNASKCADNKEEVATKEVRREHNRSPSQDNVSIGSNFSSSNSDDDGASSSQQSGSSGSNNNITSSNNGGTTKKFKTSHNNNNKNKTLKDPLSTSHRRRKSRQLDHSDSRVGLHEIISGDLKNPNLVRIEVPLGKPIEEVYEGVHDGPVLGSGISGIVRLVKHKKTGVQYAVKCLDLALIDSEEGLKQLKEEIYIMCQLVSV